MTSNKKAPLVLSLIAGFTLVFLGFTTYHRYMKNKFSQEADEIQYAVNNRQYEKSFELASRYSEKGNYYALYFLGMIYRRGYGVEPDYQKAIEIFQKGSEGAEAFLFQEQLAEMYEQGIGVPQNIPKAIELYKAVAQYEIHQAMLALGDIYYKGAGESPCDYPEALKWYKKAARQGNLNAMGRLIFMYQNGVGTPVDIPLAAEWQAKMIQRSMENASEVIKH